MTREHPVPCSLCGLDMRTRRARTLTWLDSALCQRHEYAEERRKLIAAYTAQGYGPQIAEQIANRVIPEQFIYGARAAR